MEKIKNDLSGSWVCRKGEDLMGRKKEEKPEKPTDISKIHKDNKTLDKASDKSKKPKGKVEKTLRAWLDDIDSED